MKKTTKSLLAVLLVFCMMMGLLILPVSAAESIFLPTKVEFVPSDFGADGTCTVVGNLFSPDDPPTDRSTMSGNWANIGLDIKNSTGVDLDYTVKFWLDMVLVDRADTTGSPNGTILDPDDVFSPGSRYLPTAYGSPYPYLDWDRALFNNFYLDEIGFPQVYYVSKGATNVIEGTEPTYLGGGRLTNDYPTGPYKPYNPDPDGYDQISATLAPAGEDEYVYHYSWPYERDQVTGSVKRWTAADAAQFPEIDEFAGNNTPYWDVVDMAISGALVAFLLMDYRDCEGNSAQPGNYSSGGIALIFRTMYEIVATLPQVDVGFYTDEALTDLHTTWVVNPGTTLAGVLADTSFSYTALPDPGPNSSGGEFLYWTYFDGTDWVEVPDDFLFSHSGLTYNAATKRYETIKLRAAYAGSKVLVDFKYENGASHPNSTTPLAWELPYGADPFKTVADMPGGGVLPTADSGQAGVPADAIFKGWWFYPPDGDTPVEIGPDFEFNPAAWGVTENGDGDYNFTFVARYALAPPEDPVANPYVRVTFKDNLNAPYAYIFDWVVGPNQTVGEVTGAFGAYEFLGELPTPLPVAHADGKTFVGWEFVLKDADGRVLRRIRVDDNFKFDPAALNLEKTGDEIYLCELVAVFAPRVLVRYFLDDGVTPYVREGEAAQYTWTVDIGSTVGDVSGDLPKPYPPLPVLPNKADGSTFSYWEFVLKDASGNVLQRKRVDDTFKFDPVALNLVKSGEDYVCDFIAVYSSPVKPVDPPDDIDWLPIIGGIGIGGAALGLGALGIGALGAGALGIGGTILAIPLIGKLFSQDSTTVQPRDEDTKQPNLPDDAPPPKTGDSWALPAGMSTLLAAAFLTLVLLRRRNKDEELVCA